MDDIGELPPACFDFLLGTLLLAIIMLSYSGPLEWFASCGLCGYNHESRLVPTLYHFHRTIAGGKQGHVQTLRRIQRSISGTLNSFFKVLILMQTGPGTGRDCIKGAMLSEAEIENEGC